MDNIKSPSELSHSPTMAPLPGISPLLERSPSLAACKSSKSITACVQCSKRKVRCDHRSPCSACVKHRVECEYRQKRQPQQRASRQIVTAEVKILTEKITHLELLLREHGIDSKRLSETPGSTQTYSPDQHVPAVNQDTRPETLSIAEPKPDGTVSKAQVIHGQEGYIFVNK